MAAHEEIKSKKRIQSIKPLDSNSYGILGTNYPIFRLHGNIPQKERLNIFSQFSFENQITYSPIIQFLMKWSTVTCEWDTVDTDIYTADYEKIHSVLVRIGYGHVCNGLHIICRMY